MVLLFIGTTEIIVIGGIALLIFGGKKLPELMRGLGKAVREFKEGMHEVKEEITYDNSSEGQESAQVESQNSETQRQVTSSTND